MIIWWLGESAGHFCHPAESKNVANPDFGNLKHLQNPVHLSLTKYSMSWCYQGSPFSPLPEAPFLLGIFIPTTPFSVI